MIILKKTCSACPEQYDAHLDSLEGEQVGYIRLRWGEFRVDYPDCGGETIYNASLGDGWAGAFDTAEQRDYYLRFAVDAIERRHKDGPKQTDPPPAAPDVKYQIIGGSIDDDPFEGWGVDPELPLK
jgi:hypothetical protein